MILGLFTGLLVPGGIERVGRHVGTVLYSFAREKGEPCRLFSLNDPIGNHEIEINGIPFFVKGFQRNKTAFLFAVVSLVTKVRIVYIGHLNLAPFNFLFRPFKIYSIVASHGIEVWEPVVWWRRLGLRLAAKVTAPSSYTAQSLITIQGVLPQVIEVIPWALDPSYSIQAHKKSVKKPELPSGTILLSVSRLTKHDQNKGLDTVIKALKLVQETFSDVFYLVVGEGKERLRLERLALENDVNARVIFLGKVSDKELQGYYQYCDIFVMPSKKEGFGLVFIEAMAFGKPVIGGKHGGTLDLIVQEETGFMVENGDVAGLTHCLIRLLKDVSLRNRLGEAGRRRVLEVYNFNRFKKELLNVLKGASEY